MSPTHPVLKGLVKELNKHQTANNNYSTDEFVIDILTRGCPAGITYPAVTSNEVIGNCMWWGAARTPFHDASFDFAVLTKSTGALSA